MPLHTHWSGTSLQGDGRGSGITGRHNSIQSGGWCQVARVSGLVGRAECPDTAWALFSGCSDLSAKWLCISEAIRWITQISHVGMASELDHLEARIAALEARIASQAAPATQFVQGLASSLLLTRVVALKPINSQAVQRNPHCRDGGRPGTVQKAHRCATPAT